MLIIVFSGQKFEIDCNFRQNLVQNRFHLIKLSIYIFEQLHIYPPNFHKFDPMDYWENLKIVNNSFFVF